MNAVIYSRVSTEEQAESGAGLNAQIDACLAFAAQQGWTVSGQYADEGVSGVAEGLLNRQGNRWNHVLLHGIGKNLEQRLTG